MSLAIITGASRGIGYATAAAYLAKGWRVINVSRTPCDLPSVVNIAADFGDIDWPEQIATELDKAIHGEQVVHLTHNAAYLAKDAVTDVTAQELQKNLQINVIAPAQLNQLVLPKMDADSAIIYVGSTLSEKSVANAASYSVSKHAVTGLMKATCQDLLGQGIHTCCVCPGFTDTPMLREHLNHDQTLIDALGTANAAERLVTPEEIARTIVFCADNPVLNGAVIHANLGQRES